MVGKWHLGHLPEYLPTSNGFDYYFGIPYSNDMSHPDNQGRPKISLDEAWRDQATTSRRWNTPLMRDTGIIEVPVDQRTLTRRYTDEAIQFVEAQRGRPFFLYLAHSMPHIPLFVPDELHDPDPHQAYRLVIEHIDAETGRLVAKLRELSLERDTLLVFTSDNGPWLTQRHHGGSAKPLRNGKGTTFEGGTRVPCIVWGPGRIPAGKTSDEFVATIDLLPTLSAMAGHPFKAAKPIDGLDASVTLTKGESSPRSEFLHYSSSGELEGLRQGDWKLLVLPQGKDKEPKQLLFDLGTDVSESRNFAPGQPERVAKMISRMEELDREITANARPAWRAPK